MSKKALVRLSVLLLIIALPGWLFTRQVQQSKRDRALLAAVKRNDTNGVLSLLAQGADPDVRDEPMPRLTLWEMLLSLGKGQKPSTAPTPLLMLLTMEWGEEGFRVGLPENTRIVQALLDAGANKNVQNSKGETPVYLAVADRRYASAKLLIQHGADVNIPTREGDTPLLLHLGGGQGEAPELLTMLLDRTRDVNHRENSGNTALWYAAIDDNLSVIQTLLQRGADVNIADNYGYTPLIVASMNEQIQVLKLLLRHGADPSLRCVTGDTALSWARRDKRKRSIAVLEQAGIKK
jgi:ankyrin repeat protein